MKRRCHGCSSHVASCRLREVAAVTRSTPQSPRQRPAPRSALRRPPCGRTRTSRPPEPEAPPRRRGPAPVKGLRPAPPSLRSQADENVQCCTRGHLSSALGQDAVGRRLHCGRQLAFTHGNVVWLNVHVWLSQLKPREGEWARRRQCSVSMCMLGCHGWNLVRASGAPSAMQ